MQTPGQSALTRVGQQRSRTITLKQVFVEGVLQQIILMIIQRQVTREPLRLNCTLSSRNRKGYSSSQLAVTSPLHYKAHSHPFFACLFYVGALYPAPASTAVSPLHLNSLYLDSVSVLSVVAVTLLVHLLLVSLSRLLVSFGMCVNVTERVMAYIS